MKQDGKVKEAEIGIIKEKEVRWQESCRERKEKWDGKMGKDKGRCRMGADPERL